MIGDKVVLSEDFLAPAYRVLSHKLINRGMVVSVSGESGSGKSTLALALQKVLEEKGLKTLVLHMDDYFILPPAANHNKREQDLSAVGPHEVRLDLLQQHIDAFKNGSKEILKPLVYYKENSIQSERIDLSDKDVVIVEGTYTAALKTDFSIFIARTYKDTFDDRVKRARDPITPFVEKVLAIEHKIISDLGQNADLVLDKNFQIKF